METLAEALLNVYVLAYLSIIVLAQWGLAYRLRRKRDKVAAQRRAQGLPDGILLDHAERLSERKGEALVQSLVLLASIIVTPFLLMGLAQLLEPASGEVADAAKNGLAAAFLGLLLWVLVSGTEVSKSFLGGLAFKTLAAFKAPFQVGDRVTLKGIGGKVIGFDSFFVRLQTPNDDLVSIPTNALWGETLNSSNAGQRSSLCVMSFYLSPFVDGKQRQAAEDAIWDAIQASPYFEPSLPMQIYLSQTPDAIQLTAKAYVALTYNEPLFVSDVTRAFLSFAERTRLPLASNSWKAMVEGAHPETAPDTHDAEHRD
jgi:hypothetical protein